MICYGIDQDIGGKPNARQSRLSDEAFEVMQQKKFAQHNGDRTEHWRLRSVFRGVAKRDRDAYYESLPDTAEEGMQTNNFDPSCIYGYSISMPISS